MDQKIKKGEIADVCTRERCGTDIQHCIAKPLSRVPRHKPACGFGLSFSSQQFLPIILTPFSLLLTSQFLRCKHTTNTSERKMETTRKSDLTKITAKIYAPMYADFDKQLTTALLRRDAFIDRMIAVEIPHLREDLAGKTMSPKAKRYVSQSLKGMGGRNADKLRQVSISLHWETVGALNAAVLAHNLVRDSFINWMIALLRSSDTLLERLGLPARITRFRSDGTEDMPTSPLKAIDEIQWDPLYYLRAASETQYGCGLYALGLPTELHGFSCYLPDEDVPGTAANDDKLAKDKELLADLGNFEATISPIKPKRA